MKPFGQLVTLCVMIVLFFIIMSGGMAVAMIAGADIMEPHFLLAFQGITQLLTFLLPAVLFAWLFSDNARSFLQLDFSSSKWLLALVGMLILVCLLPFSDWLTKVNDNWHWSGNWSALEERLRQQSEQSEQMIEGLLSLDGIGHLLLNLLVIALIPAVSEEMLFRGVLQQWFGRWLKNPHICILLTATIFSLAHGEIFAFLPRFMLGTVLGYLFYCSKSILVNMAVHFINNATIVVIYYFYMHGLIEQNIADDLNAPYYIVLIGVAVAVALFWIFFIKKQRREKVES